MWTKTPAGPNGSYQDSWICTIKNGSSDIGYIYGSTKKECDDNGQLIVDGVNKLSSVKTALLNISAIQDKNTELKIAKDYALTALSTFQVQDIALFKNTFWTKKSAGNVVANSPALVADLVAQTKLPGLTWINSTQYSTPVYFVDSSFPKKPVSIVQNGNTLDWLTLHKELQRGVPIPITPVAAAGTDGHITIIDVDSKKLYEFWQFKQVNGQWTASWGGIISNVDTNGAMPVVNGERWGATATGLPAIGGTILLKELQAGVIPHVLAFASQKASQSFIFPATASDGIPNTSIIPEGQIFKLPANTVVDPTWTPIIKMIVVAVRDYGMILRDKSGSTNFYCEDPIRFGANDSIYRPFWGGLELWDVMKQFPWNKLQAVEFTP